VVEANEAELEELAAAKEAACARVFEVRSPLNIEYF